MSEIIKKVFEYSLEDIMGERFGRYAKYIIQERAIPDVRDGLKPVQRRILYSMYRARNTYDKPYHKSARAVGDIIGKYHPHGDTAVYEALVRMSQTWKNRIPYIDMHGNNGSVDGDSPAASRYTETRLSKFSNELLRDIDKDTVAMSPNYDDTLLEPTVLPARFPNLLVNGAMGISAGYATNIPPHNLSEVIDATIKRIDSPNCELDTILKIMPGPDFPTGATIEGREGIKAAYEKGKGKINVKSKYEFVNTKQKNQIIITEIPYDVNKANMVHKMDEIRIEKKIDGILEVRDESDRQGFRIAIDIKKDANKELIANYLLKNTDMQVSYNFNMIAIVNRRPKLLGLLSILDAYIAHQKEVITKRSMFDLEHAKLQYHIFEGLIKAISILDEVIICIRASKNKRDAQDNLVKQFDFSEIQAEKIVTLQLYRLTNTDIEEIRSELAKLKIIIDGLTMLLSDENELKSRMKQELRTIKKDFGEKRISQIHDEIVEIKIDTTLMIQKEDVVVLVTKDGYVKRVSQRSYGASKDEETTLKDNDYTIGVYEASTLDTLLVFTNKGNYLYIPVNELPDLRWKELGKHVSNLIPIEEGEKVIQSTLVRDFDNDLIVTVFTKNGMVKRTALSDFKVQRYSKPMMYIRLKEKDEVIKVSLNSYDNIFVSTKVGYGLWFDIGEVPITGIRSSGVKSINLKNDYVVSGNIFESTSDFVLVITEKGLAKRIKLDEFEKSTRAKRGLILLKEIKSNPQKVISTFVVDSKTVIGIKLKDNIINLKSTEIPIMNRYSSGSSIVKEKIKDTFICKEIEKQEPVKKVKEEESEKINEAKVIEEIDEPKVIEEIDDKFLTIDDFLDNVFTEE